MARENIVRPLGLITQPNKLGQYPAGALSTAHNVYIRSPGVIEPSRAQAILQTMPAGDQVSLLIPSDQQLLEMALNSGIGAVRWIDGASINSVSLVAGAVLGMTSNPVTFPIDGTQTWTRSRNRFLSNANQGLLIFDYNIPTTTAQRTPRFAGLPAPYLYALPTSGTRQALAANTHCSMVATVKRVFADGYQVTSAVSAAADVDAAPTGGASDITVRVQWTTVHGLQAGDVIEIYRSRSQLSSPSPPTSCDGTYFLTASYTLTSADIAAFSATFQDTTPDTGLGREMYANPGVGGAAATHQVPSKFNVLATFKGYSFGFNKTEAASATFTVNSGTGGVVAGGTAALRTNIIGARQFTATASIGSPVLTAISAADIIGLKIGQKIQDFTVLNATVEVTITAVGVNSITVSNNAIANATKIFVAADVISINGVSFPFLSGGGWTANYLQAGFTNLATNLGSGGFSFDIGLVSSALSYVTSGNTSPSPQQFTLLKLRPAGVAGNNPTFTIAATNGQNYTPQIPELGGGTTQTVSPTVIPNGYGWTEEQQPEAWAPGDSGRIGSGTVLAAAPTRDALWIFATDGLWRLSGTGGSSGAEGFDWRVDPVDSTLSIASGQAWAVLRDTVYAYTNRGVVAIDDNSVDDTLSQGVINNLLPGPFYAQVAAYQVRADIENDEVWVIVGDNSAPVTGAWVYNYQTKTWVDNGQLIGNALNNSACFWPFKLSMAAANGNLANVTYFDNSASNYAGTMFWDYQPLSSGEPFSARQWIDETIVFDIANAGMQLQGRFNGGANQPLVSLVARSTDARVTIGVSRTAPAISETIAPGIQPSNFAPIAFRFYGVSLRSSPIGEQQVKR